MDISEALRNKLIHKTWIYYQNNSWCMCSESLGLGDDVHIDIKVDVIAGTFKINGYDFVGENVDSVLADVDTFITTKEANAAAAEDAIRQELLDELTNILP